MSDSEKSITDSMICKCNEILNNIDNYSITEIKDALFLKNHLITREIEGELYVQRIKSQYDIARKAGWGFE